MKKSDEILKSDSGYQSVVAIILVYLEGFPFWNFKVIWREVSSRFQTPDHLLYSHWHKHKDCNISIYLHPGSNL